MRTKPTLCLALTSFAFLAAAPLAAQSLPPQEAQRLVPMGPGLCGQSMALTWMATTPIDIAPMIPLALEMARFEPAWLQFVVAQPGRVTLSTASEDPESDTFLTVYDVAGRALDWDDDSGSGLNASLTVDLPSGAYCAQVRMIATPTQPATAVTLDLRMGGAAPAPAPAPEPSPATVFAPGLPCGDPATTSFAGRAAPGFGSLRLEARVPASGTSHFIVELPALVGLEITATSTEFDTMLELYASDGRLIDQNDDYTGMGTDSRIDADLAAGSYCIGVRGFAGSSGTAELTLTEVGFAPPPPAPDAVAGFDPFGPCGGAGTVDLGVLRPGSSLRDAGRTVPPGDRFDWSLTVEAPMDVQIDAGSTVFDTILTLFDRGGVMLAENDDFAGLGTDSRLIESLAAGTYCIGVRGFAGGGGAMQLDVAALGAAEVATPGPGLTPAPVPAPSPAPTPAPAPAGDVTSGTDFGGTPGTACTEPLRTGHLGIFDGATAPRAATVRIPAGGRADWRLTVSAPVELRLTAESGSFDTVLGLFDGRGTMLAENDDAPGGLTTDSLLDWRMDPGEYCVTLRGFGMQGGEGTVRVALPGAGPAAPAPAPTPAPGPVVPPSAGGGPAPGEAIDELGTLVDRLEASAVPGPARWWMAFDVTESGSVRVDATNLGRGFSAVVTDAQGRTLAEGRGAGGFTPLVLFASVNAGRHLLLIEAENPNDRAARRVTLQRD